MEEGQPAPLSPLIFFVLFLSLAGAGCSGKGWLARIFMVKAEQAFTKAYAMRIKREISYEERLKHYRTACDYFYKAFRYEPQIFTLSRIGSAAESCLRIEDFEREKEFREFEEEYARAHPDEVTYGDAWAFMSLE